ncbi:MAG: MORN repeat-containing protein [Oceanococcus sp.]
MNRSKLLKVILLSTPVMAFGPIALGSDYEVRSVLERVQRDEVSVLEDIFVANPLKMRRWAQLVWDNHERRLKRVIYEAADPLADANLDPSFIAAGDTKIESGPASGHGEIIWRKDGPNSINPTIIVASYNGYFESGTLNGYGLFQHMSGMRYNGRWKDGRPQGEGQLHFPNGDEYVGRFENGLPHGDGVYVDASGAIYDGGFAGGKRSGTGTIYHPGKAAVFSQWSNGKQIDGTATILQDEERRFPLQLAASYDQVPNVKINLIVDRTHAQRQNGPAFTAVEYAGSSESETLKLTLANKSLYGVWRGTDNLVIRPGIVNIAGELSEFGFWGLADEIQPVPILVEIENDSARAIGIEEAWIDVEQSIPDSSPALQIYSPDSGTERSCDPPTFDTEFLIKNFGWAPIMQSTLTYSIGSTKSKKVEIGTIEDEPIILSFESDLSDLGFDTESLKESALPCENSHELCFTDLDKRSLFGDFAANVHLNPSGYLTLPIKGEITTQWIDAETNVKKRKSPFATFLVVGRFYGAAECGEGGMRDTGRDRPFELRLQGANYEIGLPIQDTINRSVRASWRIKLQAKQSSMHRFRFVFRLEDGSLIASRPVELEYFKPKTFYYDEKKGYDLSLDTR